MNESTNWGDVAPDATTVAVHRGRIVVRVHGVHVVLDLLSARLLADDLRRVADEACAVYIDNFKTGA